jgi:hypothetical protein
MTTIKPPKSKKIPYLRWQSDARKNCATIAVKIMLTHTTTLCAADLISNGKSSLGTNHPKGPQDLPYANTNMNITTTKKMLTPNDNSFPLPNSRAKTTAVATCTSNCSNILAIRTTNSYDWYKIYYL